MKNIKTAAVKDVLKHFIIISVILFSIVFIFFNRVLPFMTNKDRIVTVPEVNGMDLTIAIKFLKARELDFEVTDSIYNSAIPALTVMRQYPRPASKVKVNRKINLIVLAKHAPDVQYPDLTGVSFDFAQKKLSVLDLKIGRIQYRPDIAHNIVLESLHKGSILRSGNKIAKGSFVDLIIGSQNDKFSLPDFRGMELDVAEGYVMATQLKVKQVHWENGDSSTLNKITKQLPLPGDTVRHGDGVEFWISNF